MEDPNLEQAILWLREAIEGIAYGNVVLTLVVHDHRMQRVERSTTESTLASGRPMERDR